MHITYLCRGPAEVTVEEFAGERESGSHLWLSFSTSIHSPDRSHFTECWDGGRAPPGQLPPGPPFPFRVAQRRGHAL